MAVLSVRLWSDPSLWLGKQCVPMPPLKRLTFFSCSPPLLLLQLCIRTLAQSFRVSRQSLALFVFSCLLPSLLGHCYLPLTNKCRQQRQHRP
ncbi:hypothetical protein DUNSADRAFT_15876 [Dunaliella salina]|uniref:Encoded protein n=1 Tax=Dunaliella salina TaxID=3046 RepID=A0ABQ7G4R3_DUNSA|nr:hypothetical protein DUNSADRAFT_15876 [Dunaliella salina]|eukprot:KAF5829577.1 hypothetical protein DUNSADRAFT_15876 [Dunaliella salina]